MGPTPDTFIRWGGPWAAQERASSRRSAPLRDGRRTSVVQPPEETSARRTLASSPTVRHCTARTAPPAFAAVTTWALRPPGNRRTAAL
jgi:hypothetical protein